MAAMKGLGRLFDFGLDFVPVDLNTAGATGARFNLSVATGITFVVGLAVAGGGTDDDVMTIQQHTAYTGGTSSTLASASVATSTGITVYHVKSEATLDNDEPWTEVTMAEGGVITLLGATYAAKQVLFAVYVGADQLGDTYTHVSLNFADPGSGGSRLGFCLGVVHDLAAQRKPSNLPNLLRPGSVNV